MRHEDVRAAGRVAEEAGAFARKAARADGSAHSTLGRIAQTAGAVRLGARLLPVAWRLFRRYPVISCLVVAGAMVALTRSSARMTVRRRTSSGSILPKSHRTV
jgi:hypothetical protein